MYLIVAFPAGPRFCHGKTCVFWDVMQANIKLFLSSVGHPAKGRECNLEMLCKLALPTPSKVVFHVFGIGLQAYWIALGCHILAKLISTLLLCLARALFLSSQRVYDIGMNQGYVFPCEAESLKSCLRSRLFTCSGETANEIGPGYLVFFFNANSDTLVGPFTASGSSRTGPQPGAWTEVIDQHSFSGNFRVEWEELHEMKGAKRKFPFLKDLHACKLSSLQVEDMIEALKKAPPFHQT